jgi:hypothetical protein
MPAGCAAAALTPFRIEREAEDVVFVQLRPENRMKIVWPYGIDARLVDGRAVLYASDGTVVGEEGDVLGEVGGADGREGFYVYSIGLKNCR